MTFTFKCNQCGTELEAQDEWIGMKTNCPKCSHSIEIRPAEPPPPPPRLSTVKQIPIRQEPAQPEGETTFSCRACQQDFPIQESWRGAVVSCPHCGTGNKIPMPGESAEGVQKQPREFLFICPECDSASLLPSYQKGKSGTCPFCGETVVMVPSTTRTCPSCRQTIKISAQVCKFCHKNVPPVVTQNASGAGGAVKGRNYSNAAPTAACGAVSGELAGIGERFLALLLDWLILIIPNIIINFILPFIGYYLTLFLYEALMVKTCGGTLGKKALHLQVVFEDNNGEPPTWGQAFGRGGAKALSAFILGIGFLMACFNPERKAMHDSMCHSSVYKIHQKA